MGVTVRVLSQKRALRPVRSSTVSTMLHPTGHSQRRWTREDCPGPAPDGRTGGLRRVSDPRDRSCSDGRTGLGCPIAVSIPQRRHHQRVESPTAAPSPSQVSSTAASAPVPKTLNFTGTTVDGTSLHGSSLVGKPVLFWFWAPWCPTCRSQIPQVEGLAHEYGPDLAVVGVGSLDSADAIQDFANDTPGVSQLSDPDGALWRHFGIAEQSSYVLLDATGKQVLKSGYGGHADLEQRVADVVR